MIVPRVFKSRQRKRKNISIVLSSQSRASTRNPRIGASSFIRRYFSPLSGIFFITY